MFLFFKSPYLLEKGTEILKQYYVRDLLQNNVGPPREMEIKTKPNKRELMKLKSFCKANETKNKTKRKLVEWEKIFVNHTSDRGLISGIYKELLQLNNRKQTI